MKLFESLERKLKRLSIMGLEANAEAIFCS
jgi:hypothetical protein